MFRCAKADLVRAVGSLLLAVSSLAYAVPLEAQGGVFGGLVQAPDAAPQNGPTGTVTGMVIAQDTQRPVRLAPVQLQSVDAAQGNGGQGRYGGFAGSVNVRSDVDGSFIATRVAVGDYYVTAAVVGYVSVRSELQNQIAAGADPAAVLAKLPTVHVTADNTSNITVTVQRGGALAGHVEWEDGSPASGVPMNAISAAAAPAISALRGFAGLGGGSPYATTDDQGNFRVSGLATGDYLLSATLPGPTQQGGAGLQLSRNASPLRVWGAGVFRKAEAKPISVRAGDERTDVRMVIDLRGLHAVSGHASSGNLGQSVASGNVRLTDNSDGSLQTQAQIDAEGSFKLRYVPPGTYTLTVTGASSVAPANFRGGRGGGQEGGSSSQQKGVTYQEFSTTVVVGDTDVTGMAVGLVPVQKQ